MAERTSNNLMRGDVAAVAAAAVLSGETRRKGFTRLWPFLGPALIAPNAETTHADLIGFAMHGKAGTKAFWANSVGARVLVRTPRPALLVPVK